MTFLRNLRQTTRIASTNPYVASYIQNAAVNVANIPSISRIPSGVPLDTLVMLTTFQPTVIPGGLTQTAPQNMQAISDAMKARLQASGRTSTRLNNFKPSIPGNQIQRRVRPAGSPAPRDARQAVLAGINPETRKLVQDLQDLKKLQELQNLLNLAALKLEQEITKYTAIFNALINAPDAAVSGALTLIIDKLDLAERAYTAAKNLVIAVAKAIKNTVRAIIKAFTDTAKAVKRIRTGFDALKKILKIPEIKFRIQFPKFPKKPRITLGIPDFYQKFKKQLDILKDKNSKFYQTALRTAIDQSGMEIIDPKKDKIQRGLTIARNSLKELRAQYLAKQAVRNEAINRARNQLIQNIRRTTAVTERERERIIRDAAAQKRKSQNLLQKAQSRLSDLTSRRKYLTPDEQRMIKRQTGINLTRTNILGDLPYKLPIIDAPGDTGFTTPDNRTVYIDRRTNRLYVLQSPQERVAELAGTAGARLTATRAEATAFLNTINTAVATAAEVKGSLNNNVLKAQFGQAVLGVAQSANRITNDARTAQQQAQEESNAALTTNAAADANIIFETDEFSIDNEAKTVTTKTRRFSAAKATNEATNYNTTTAAFNGYTIPLTINASGPRRIQVNGQEVYELVLTIEYRDFNPLNEARFERLKQAELALNLYEIPPPTPITGLPISVQLAAQDALLPAAQRQQIAELNTAIAAIDAELAQTVNLDGTPISGEQRAGLRAYKLSLQEQIRRIRAGETEGRIRTNTVYSIETPTTDLTNITIPLPPVSLPPDRVEQLGRIITARVSGLDFQATFNKARELTRQRAIQSGFGETPRTDSQYTETRDLAGRIIYNFVFTADYIVRGQTSDEDVRASRQLQVNSLLQQGITPAQINAQYSPPGPVDETGNVI